MRLSQEPLEYWRQRASLKSVTGHNSPRKGLPSYRRPLSFFKASAAWASVPNFIYTLPAKWAPGLAQTFNSSIEPNRLISTNVST